MSIDSDLIRGHVDTIILKTLTSGDKYGYEIIKEIDEKSNGTYELKQPTLYSCLKRLENQGLISAYWKNSDIGGKRHYYKLTKKGRENYEENMSEWFASRNIIDNLMGSKTVSVPEGEEVVTEKIDEISEPETFLVSTPLPQESIQEEPSAKVKDSAQLFFDDTQSIVQEAEPRDFEITSLDEEESALLEGYYRTDENQINFLDIGTGENVENNDPSELEPTISAGLEDDDISANDTETTFNGLSPITSYSAEKEEHQEDDNQAMLDAFFHKYEGTDVNKYKQNTGEAYYEKIKDDSDVKPLNLEDNYSRDYNNFTFNDIKQEPEPTPPAPELKLFGGDNTDYINNERLSDDEPEEYYGKSSESYNSSSLNFGSNFYTDDEDDGDLNMPKTFLNIDNRAYEESSKNEEEEISDYTSSFGEENDDNDDFDDEDKNYNTSNELELFSGEEPIIYSRPSNNLTAAARPAFTELENKEKLNHLSSYASSPAFDVKIEHNNDTYNKDYAELKEELGDAGFTVRTYEKQEKEPREAKTYLLVNKIKCVTSWINYAVMIVLLALTYLVANKVGYTDLSLTTTSLSPIMHFVIAALVMLILPGFYTTLYLFNRTKKVKPNYSALISIIFALLFFIVCINIIYLVNILLGFTKFTQTDFNHLLWLIPSVCVLFIVVQSVVYTILYKSKRFTA